MLMYGTSLCTFVSICHFPSLDVTFILTLTYHGIHRYQLWLSTNFGDTVVSFEPELVDYIHKGHGVVLWVASVALFMKKFIPDLLCFLWISVVPVGL